MPAPNATQRQRCYEGRDSYYACLKENDGDKSKCSEQLAKYEEVCPKTWVKYFDKQQQYKRYKAQLVEGGAVYSDQEK